MLAGMLLNLQRRYRGRRLQAPKGTDLIEALHVAGLGAHTACFSAAAVHELQAAEFPNDALWVDRIHELDGLVCALLVSFAGAPCRRRRSLLHSQFLLHCLCCPWYVRR